MAGPLDTRIELLVAHEARGSIKPEHAAELAKYRQDGRVPQPKRPETFKKDSAYLTKKKEIRSAAREGMDRLDEFDRINDLVRPDGGFVGNALNTVKGMLGDSDLARFKALQADIARRSRQIGEGSTSDFDAKQFMTMTGGPDKPSGANKQYSAFGRKVFQKQIDYHDFQEQYLAKNGTLLGDAAAFENLQKKAPPRTRTKDGWGAEMVE